MRRLVLALAASAVCGCGPEARPPTAEEIELARSRLEVAVHAAERVRSALELLGLLPVYTCGEPRRTFVGQAAESAHVSVSCVTATAEARGDTADAILLSFAAGGCSARGHSVVGQAEFLYSGGEDRLDLSADLHGLTVDGTPLQTSVGYGTCGDEQRYFASSSGQVPAHADHAYQLNGQVAQREGPPVIGGSTLLIDGSGNVTGPAGKDAVTLTGVKYEVGEYLPEEGDLLVTTAGGKEIRAVFQPGLWRLGKVQVQVDDSAPVTVPVVR